MKLYVGNLPYEVSETDLKTIFSEYGEVVSANIISDRDTGRPKGFGFVEMSNKNEAETAMENLNGKEVKGRNIKVNEARPRDERPKRPRY